MLETRSKNVWKILLIGKLLQLSVIFATLFFQYRFGDFDANGPGALSATMRAFSKSLDYRDAAYYLSISESGYHAGSPDCAFYPLWPMLIRAMCWLTSLPPIIVALALANILSLAACWHFYRLVELQYGEVTARHSLIILIAFPSAFFLSIPYTESLYLLMVALLLRGLQEGTCICSIIVAFLMPLTKAIGVFSIFPIVWHLRKKKRRFGHWLLILAPIFGYVCYFVFMYISTGDAIEGFAAQRAFPNSPSVRNMLNPGGFIHAFLISGSLDGMLNSMLDRGLFILFVSLLPLIYRLNRTWFVYSLPAGLIPAMTSWFISYRRYVLACLPIFVILARLLYKKDQRWIFWYYVFLMAAMQIWAIIQLLNARWVG